MNKSDQTLIKKILKGDTAASKLLYMRYEQSWFQICLRYGRNRSEAQDILQEGVLQLFKVLNKFNAERGVFKSWSSKVIVNAALQYLKRNQWQQSFEDLSIVENKADWSVQIMEKISAKELTLIIQTLPSGYRFVFNMYAIEGYSHREIAETLNISIGTSKSQLSKAKRLLRAKLKVLYVIN